jgi:hypothetical protein
MKEWNGVAAATSGTGLLTRLERPDDEQNVERTGEAGVNGHDEWCSQRGGLGVGGLNGICGDGSRQVPPWPAGRNSLPRYSLIPNCPRS